MSFYCYASPSRQCAWARKRSCRHWRCHCYFYIAIAIACPLYSSFSFVFYYCWWWLWWWWCCFCGFLLCDFDLAGGIFLKRTPSWVANLAFLGLKSFSWIPFILGKKTPETPPFDPLGPLWVVPNPTPASFQPNISKTQAPMVPNDFFWSLSKKLAASPSTRNVKYKVKKMHCATMSCVCRFWWCLFYLC